jgi:hypothetical protein
MSEVNTRFAKAIEALDSYNMKDPNKELVDGKSYPKELLYAMRMSETLKHYAPDADDITKLAARCQHIGRWEIPRGKYPEGKKGYLQWRSEEKMHHARIAESLLDTCGYDTDTIEKVKFLLLKKELFTNPQTQLLEDVVCLVFIEHYLDEFAAKHEDDKVIDILRKTMKKMTPRAIQAVGNIKLSERMKGLISKAASAS